METNDNISIINEVENFNMDEYLHWRNVRATILSYRDIGYFDIDRRRKRLKRLVDTKPTYMTLLSSDILNGNHFRLLEDAIDSNQDFFDCLIDFHDDSGFAPVNPNNNDNSAEDDSNVNYANGQHRNLAILHSFYREWSSEGKEERDSCFEPIINELSEFFAPIGIPYQKRILVPGCGLARLPLEIVRLGLCCEGNEFSAYMCIGSNFVLNGIENKDEFTIYPWLDRVCNVVNNSDVLIGINIPDISAMDILSSSEYSNNNNNDDIPAPYPRFSMSTGDFMDVYGSPENQNSWDGVVTCFFLDTAPVILDYITNIYRILKSGGIWVNNGPLLYHWVDDSEGTNDDRYKQSIELSWEDVKHSIQLVGFTIVKEERKTCHYTNFKNSMIKTVYETVLFTAIKK